MRAIKSFDAKRFLLVLTLLLAIYFIVQVPVIGEEFDNFESAKLAAQGSDKRILLEFYRESCEYCHKAEEESTRDPLIISALKGVIHLRLNAREGEGYEIANEFDIGYTFPVYILCDEKGNAFYRWIGYTDSKSFLSQLQFAQNQKLTIKELIEVQDNNPSFDNARFLGKYFEEALQYLLAAKYYRQAEDLNPGSSGAFLYKIFKNMASGAWNNKTNFESVMPFADSILNASVDRPYDIVRMASSITNLARKLKRTDDIKNYLELGIHSAKANRNNENIAKYYPNLLADYALHFSKDTAMAMRIKTSSYAKGWRSNPLDAYRFAKWCLDRAINLTEAEKMARSAVAVVKDGYYKGTVYNTVAQICFLQGNKDEAIQMMQTAIQQDPENDFYWDRLKEYQDSQK